MILIVGSANVDLVVAAERFPAAGETLLGKTFQTFSGGKGANQAVAVARAGGAARFIGRIGPDAMGQRLYDDLEIAGVQVDTLRRVDHPSGVALIVTTASGENAIVVAPGANSALTADVIEEEAAHFAGGRIVLAQLETALDGVLRAAQLTRANGGTFILDPAPAQPLPAELIALTDWLTPNQTEACTLLGVEEQSMDPASIARALMAAGARNVLLKMSSRGALVLEEGHEPVLVPAFPVQAVDTTAAGDCFNGAFAVALSEGATPVEATRFAAAAAALSVTRVGAQPSMPTRGEIDHRLSTRP